MKLGEYFTLAEFTASATAGRIGDANEPDAESVANLRLLVANVLDPLREHIARPVRVTSGYRSAAVNSALGGATSSQHTTGEAADIDVDGLGAEDLARAIHDAGLPYDQLIFYAPSRGGHVHVSYEASREGRRQVLYARDGGGYSAVNFGRRQAPRTDYPRTAYEAARVRRISDGADPRGWPEWSLLEDKHRVGWAAAAAAVVRAWERA